MFTLEYAKEPKYISADGQEIWMIVKWEEFSEEMPFNATSFDVEKHGVDLYNRAKAGEFGTVAEYVPPQPETQPE
jgi:hypothetical protein